MTLDQIARLVQASLPGLPIQIIRAQIQANYTAYCRQWEWAFLEREFSLTTFAQLSGTDSFNTATGVTTDDLSTVYALGSGSSPRTLPCPVMMRINGESELYTITTCAYTSDPSPYYTLTLSPSYVGAVDTTASYEIFRSVYLVDTSVRDVLAVRYETALEEKDPDWLDRVDPQRQVTGTPTVWVTRGVYSTANPTQMIEIWPRPTEQIALTYRAKIEPGILGASDTPLIDEQLLLYQALVDLTPVYIAQVKDAALAQMVKLNSKDWREQRDRLYHDLVMEDMNRHSPQRVVRDVLFGTESPVPTSHGGYGVSDITDYGSYSHDDV